MNERCGQLLSPSRLAPSGDSRKSIHELDWMRPVSQHSAHDHHSRRLGVKLYLAGDLAACSIATTSRSGLAEGSRQLQALAGTVSGSNLAFGR